jgi:anaerobic magnesium-protoporphyrin IX monomethyl ester cyclase
LQRHGIQAGMFIMLGYEGEELRDLDETVAHLKICNPDIFLTTVAYPIKGTPYYAEVESRVLSDKTWRDRSDRDLTVAGRHSRRFYSFATRWLVNSVALHRANVTGAPLLRRAKLATNVVLGRAGMLLTHGQREQARPTAANSEPMPLA